MKSILLPTDFGPSSARAAELAGALAQRFGASIHLVHVLEEPFTRRGPAHQSTEASSSEEQRYYEFRAKLGAFAAATLQSATDRITLEVRTGTPWKAIVAAAVDYGADLIVMSRPADRGMSHLTSTVPDRVIRTAPCPVVAVQQPGGSGIHTRARAA
jgi:nucleotide-binding universal stress UspA family protein